MRNGIKFYIGLISFYGFVIIYSVVVRKSFWEPIQIPLLEGLLFLAIILVLFINSSIREYVSGLPHRFKIFLMILVFFLGTAQYIHKDIATFPFAPWVMYSKTMQTDSIGAYFITGVDEQGKEVQINYKKVFPALAHGTFRSELRRRFKTMELKDDLSVSAAEHAYRIKPEPHVVKKPNSSMDWISKKIGSTFRCIYAPRAKRTFDEYFEESNIALRGLMDEHIRQNPHLKFTKIRVRKNSANVYEKFNQEMHREIIWEIDYEK